MIDWIRSLQSLEIGKAIAQDGVLVARLSENRMIVVRAETVYNFGGNRSRLGYVIAEVASFVTRERMNAPCADCGSPRQRRSYCNACWSARTQRYKAS